MPASNMEVLSWGMVGDEDFIIEKGSGPYKLKSQV
jgi:hypothetical protein